jgi:TonB family protein
MVTRWRTVLSIVSSLAATVSFDAKAEAPAGNAQAVWQVGWQDSHCTISTTNSDGVVLALWMLPGDPDPHLYLVGSSKILPRSADKATVQLAPNGESFPADVDLQPSRDAVVLKMMNLRHKFPPAFAASNELRVAAGGKQIRVPIPGSARAMAALHQCIDDKLPQWGVDQTAYDALQVPPTDIEDYHWMSPEDYPQALLDANWAGDVIVRLNVDGSGKVTNCTVVVSSGQKSADDVSCLRAMQKGKFNPAMDADGKPTAAQRVRDVVFRIAQ